MKNSSFKLKTLTPHIGAEVTGIDLSQPLNDKALAELRKAWAEWKVLVFRDQTLDRAQHKAFAEHFGSLHVHPMNKARNKNIKDERYRSDPAILTVKTTAKSAYTAGDGWHTDVTCDPIPPLGSMLYITETPECGGGDTLFADMYLAYELLSEPMKAFLEGLSAVHDGGKPYVGSYKSTPPRGRLPAIRAPRCHNSSRDRPQSAIHQQRFHYAHQGPGGQRIRRPARHAVQTHRLYAQTLLPGRMDTGHPDLLGQSLHPTSRCVGLPSALSIWRTGVDTGRSGTGLAGRIPPILYIGTMIRMPSAPT